MIEILYLFFLLIIMNIYLNFRVKDRLSIGSKIMVTLLSIMILLALFKLIGVLLDQELAKRESPAFNLFFMLFMTLVMPLVITETVQQVYNRFVMNKKEQA